MPDPRDEGMDWEEWGFWKKQLPEVLTWLPREVARKAKIPRVACLAAVEQRAFSLSAVQADRWQALASQWAFHRLPGDELELVIRVFLEIRAGRHPDFHFGEMGRRILVAAERKADVNQSYLDRFRALVEAEAANE